MNSRQRAAIAATILLVAAHVSSQPARGAEAGLCEIACGASFAACVAGAVFGNLPPLEYCGAWLEGCMVGCDFEE